MPPFNKEASLNGSTLRIRSTTANLLRGSGSTIKMEIYPVSALHLQFVWDDETSFSALSIMYRDTPVVSFSDNPDSPEVNNTLDGEGRPDRIADRWFGDNLFGQR